jgi:hypothetical protein
MKPVFFPHTFMPPSAAAAIQAFFPAVAAYQPTAGRLPEGMQALVHNGFLEVVPGGPAGENPERLAELVRELELWGGRHHQGTGLQPAYLHERRRGEGLASELTAAVRRRAGGASEEPTDPLTVARIFLHFAQEFDARTQESEATLEELESRQAELFAALRGEAPPAARAPGRTPGPKPEDGADYLLERRIEAWMRLFLGRPYPSPVFITCRPEVLEILSARFPRIRRLSPQDLPAADPSAAADLLSRLRLLASGPEPARPEPAELPGGGAQSPAGAFPAIHLVPGLPPLTFFQRLLPDGPVAEQGPSSAGAWRHTLIVLVA